MKAHTSSYKENIAKFGRELNSKVTYELDGETIELGSEELNSITPHYEGAILKSVMKQLDIDSNVEIPVGTILTYEFGLKVGNEYEYISFGNYVVKTVEKQEDTRSWLITCYDKMLYTMKDYENSGIVYPITVRDYIGEICEKVGLTFASINDKFVNYDKEISSELYLDNEGRSLEYTFRTVLDELAQVTASTICINEDDELEIRYIKDAGELINVTGSSIELNTNDDTELNSFELQGKTEQDGTPSPDYPSELKSVGYENKWLLPNSNEQNGITFTKNNNGTFNISGTASVNTNFISWLSLDNFNNNTTYTLCSNYSINGLEYRFEEYTAVNGSWIKQYLKMGNSGVDFKKSAIIQKSSGTYARLSIYVYAGTTLNLQNVQIQLTKGTQQHSYIPYGKYGVEVVSRGKNLFNINGNVNVQANNEAIVSRNSVSNNILTAASNSMYTYSAGQKITNLNGKTIKFSAKVVSVGTPASGYTSKGRISIYDNGIELANATGSIGEIISASATCQSNSTICSFNTINGTGAQFTDIQVEIGTERTNYEPYQENTTLFTLNEPLRNWDRLYYENGKVYVERNTGNVVFDGSENWEDRPNYTYADRFVFVDGMPNQKRDVKIGFSNYFKVEPTLPDTFPYITPNNSWATVNFSSKGTKTLADFKSWLSTHNTEVQYQLATPTIEDLGYIDMPVTYSGKTYIDTTDELEPNMALSYVSNYDIIDEEYLKDINVNFGEKFGPVNTLILSRGGDGDKIALSKPTDLADEDKIAIQITDNQIMNDNNRADFMEGILNKLYGLEYYINDFSSTGITYYDLCDRYRVKVGNNTYKCIMFNDEVDITQGLQEYIYTEMQEENESDYKYMKSDDRDITQANIIAKKNEGKISEITQTISGENGLSQRVSRVETTQDATSRTIDIITTNIDTTTGEVREVTTTTGFTFNADGMTIEDTSSNFKAQHRNTGTYYKDGNDIVGQYTKDGSKQKDLELFGVYSYGKEEIEDTPMFVAQLFTDENGEECFGHFYNGV